MMPGGARFTSFADAAYKNAPERWVPFSIKVIFFTRYLTSRMETGPNKSTNDQSTNGRPGVLLNVCREWMFLHG
jgi:hypothetical protein